MKDGELSLKFYSRQDQKADYSVTFNARFKLPNLESHTYLFTGRDTNAGVVTDRPAVFANKQRLLQPNSTLDSSFFAGWGARWVIRLMRVLDFKADSSCTRRAAIARNGNIVEMTPSSSAKPCFVTAGKTNSGLPSVASYQHQFSPTLVGRWLNVVDVTQNDTDAEWNSSLGLFKSMGQQRLLSLELLASAKQNTGLPLTDYGLQMRWEQPVLQQPIDRGDYFWPLLAPVAW